MSATNSGRWVVLLPVAIIVAGCSSIDSSIQKSVAKGDFRTALARLETKKAGANAAANLKPDLTRAREGYQKAVEIKFLAEGKQIYSEGKPRGAVAVLEEGVGLCSWSVSLQQLLRDYRDSVARIDLLYEDWKDKSSQLKQDIANARRFLSVCEAIRRYLADSPNVQHLLEAAESSVIRDGTVQIASFSFGASAQLLEKMSEELQRLTTMSDVAQSLPQVLACITHLPATLTPTNGVPLNVQNLTGTYRQVVGLETKAKHDFTAELWKATATKLEDWVRLVFAPALESAQCASSYISFGESLVSELPEKVQPSLKRSISTAYLNRAETWAGSGLESALSLVFLDRYERLGGIYSGRAQNLRARASSALASAFPVRSQLYIEINPKVDPTVTGILFWWAYSEILTRSKSWQQWDGWSSDKSRNSMKLDITGASLVVEGVNQLKPVTSTYLSHFEDVPNPLKATLGSQVNFARLQADFAESSYNSAVSSHNIYPTVYSLANVNNAKNNYVAAVNRFNSLVQSYNLTPLTISRPVHMPYTFHEGDFRFGWSIDASCGVNGKTADSHADSIASDHVRLGTKLTDANPGYRRDDSLDIDLTAEASIRHLASAFRKLYEDVNKQLLGFQYSSRKDLDAQEQHLLSWLLHPWGPQTSLLEATEIPTWVRDVDTGRILHFEPPDPPVIALKDARPVGENLATEELSKQCGGFVCQILAESKEKPETSSSGVLIGPEGLILTCAHAVVGRSPRIKFHEGENSGTYEAEVLYLNFKRDVALLKAKQLRATAWAKVRLDRPVQRGEEIVAIGNPSLPGGEVNVLGVSRGVVSNPEAQVLEEPYLVADISIASGSSGGPLFSTKDGAVVGIVLSIASPHITKEGVSSSGFTCLAAPAIRLEGWLGLRSETIEPK